MVQFLGPIIEIKEIVVDIDKKGQFYKHTITTLFTLFRQHLEANNLKDIYKVLNFYSNWLLHPALERGHASILLDDFEKLYQPMPPGYYENDVASLVLSLRELRTEVLDLLHSLKIDGGVFDSYKGWKAIISTVLLPSLIDKPLIRRQEYKNSSKYTQSLVLILEDSSNSKSTVRWRIERKPTGHFVEGGLAFTERPEDFLHP